MLSSVAADLGRIAQAEIDANASRDDHVIETLLRTHQAEILRVVAAGVQRVEQGEATDLRHGFPFRLDPAHHEVRIGRRRVALSAHEYAVVELLWQQMPLYVSREDLLTHLYGEGVTKAPRVIDVFLHRIRNKLVAAGCTDATIQSKPGKGWRLDLALPDDTHRLGDTLRR